MLAWTSFLVFSEDIVCKEEREEERPAKVQHKPGSYKQKNNKIIMNSWKLCPKGRNEFEEEKDRKNIKEILK